MDVRAGTARKTLKGDRRLTPTTLNYPTQSPVKGSCAGHSAAIGYQKMWWQRYAEDRQFSGQYVLLQGRALAGVRFGGINTYVADFAVVYHGICDLAYCPNHSMAVSEAARTNAASYNVRTAGQVTSYAQAVALLQGAEPAAINWGGVWLWSMEAAQIADYQPHPLQIGQHALAWVDVDAAGWILAVDPRNVQHRVKRISPTAAQQMLSYETNLAAFLQGVAWQP